MVVVDDVVDVIVAVLVVTLVDVPVTDVLVSDVVEIDDCGRDSKSSSCLH